MKMIYRACAGLCIGYSFCHIFIQYFILQLIFRPLDIRLGSKWGTDINSEQLLSILILGAVLLIVAKADQKVFQTFSFIGMAIWIAAGIFM